MSNIKSFSDMNKDKKSANKESYVGGGQSGLAVENDNDLAS